MPDIFDEVDEELRADQARALLRRYAGVLIAAMILTLLGVGAYHLWQEQQDQRRDAVATKFLDAQKAAEKPKKPANLAQQFSDIAASAPAGYRTLARLQLAAVEWEDNQHAKAFADWQAVADDGTAPQVLRNLATLTLVRYQLDDGNAAALKAKLEPLAAGGTRLQPMAWQLLALLDIRLGETANARKTLQQLVDNPQTPQGIRQTSQDVLINLGNEPATSGKAGKHG